MTFSLDYSYFEIILWCLFAYTIYIIIFGIPRKIKNIIENMGSGASGNSTANNSKNNKPGSKVVPFFPCMKTYKTMPTCNADYRCHWKFNRCVRKHKNLCKCTGKPNTTTTSSPAQK